MKPYKEEERKKLESKLIFAAAEKKTHPREKKKLPKNLKEQEEEEIKNKEKERMVMGRMGVGIRVEGTRERES
jgi:hypothetical protein